ncbi:MAG: hypothetical protein ACRD0D_11845, partial [Acidimicrobiales bacterium]
HLAWRCPSAVRGVAAVDGGTIELSRQFPTWDACRAALSPPPLEGRRLAEVEAMVRARHPDWPESGIQGLLACFEHRADGTVAPWLTRDRHLEILAALWEHRPSALYGSVDHPVLLVACGEGPAAAEVDKAAGGLRRGRAVRVEADHDVHAQRPGWLAGTLLDCFATGFFP